jgi:hypothetical protein
MKNKKVRASVAGQLLAGLTTVLAPTQADLVAYINQQCLAKPKPPLPK